MRTILFAFLFLFSVAANAQQKPVLSPDAMKEDFGYLRGYLERTHPMLYMNYGKVAMQQKMDSLALTMDKPLPFLEFYKKIAKLITMVGCEHTSCSYGSGFDKLLQAIDLFPYQLYFSQGKAQVLVNLTTAQDISPGDELLAINGRSIDSIRLELHQYVPTDGWSVSAKDHALSGMAFNIWYHLFIDQAKEFKVTFKTADGKLINKTVRAVGLAKLNAQAIKNPANAQVLELDKRQKEKRKQILRLELLPEKHTAVLTVQSFASDMRRFNRQLDSCFSLIATSGAEKLVIDLSGNDGGEVELAADLLNHFITAPTSIVEYSYLLTDSDEDFKLANIPEDVRQDKYQFIQPLKDGKAFTKLSKYAGELKLLQPRNDRFKGKVYLLVSGGTSSAASTFVAVMKSLKLATVVGQETAGGYAGGGTVIGLDLELPNSKIKVHSGLIYQRFRTSGVPGQGVVPDVPYAQSLKATLAGERQWLDFILKLE